LTSACSPSSLDTLLPSPTRLTPLPHSAPSPCLYSLTPLASPLASLRPVASLRSVVTHQTLIPRHRTPLPL
jgi:hypothetical protein